MELVGGSNFGGDLKERSPRGGPVGEPLAGGLESKPPEAEETLQIVHIGKVFCASHVVPERQNGYITCDALYWGRSLLNYLLGFESISRVPLTTTSWSGPLNLPGQCYA